MEVEFSHPKSKNDTKDEWVLEKLSILSMEGEVIEIATMELNPNMIWQKSEHSQQKI